MNLQRSKRRNDIILIAGLLMIGVVLFVLVNILADRGGTVEIQVDGEVAATYPLDRDNEVDLHYNGHNLLLIKNGEADIINADCPDKLCVEQRRISKKGETIVCLPHKTVVKITDGKDSEFDGIVK